MMNDHRSEDPCKTCQPAVRMSVTVLSRNRDRTAVVSNAISCATRTCSILRLGQSVVSIAREDAGTCDVFEALR